MATSSSGNFLIELHRCIDDLIYKYEPSGVRNGRPYWRRVDLELYLHWSERRGWVISDEGGLVLGLPWDVGKDEQGTLPPDGTWVSRKGPKSYVYQQKHIAAL